MPYTLAYLPESDFQNGMNATWAATATRAGLGLPKVNDFMHDHFLGGKICQSAAYR
jgi:hypothetical protein